MAISDKVGRKLDSNAKSIVVLFNVDKITKTISLPDYAGIPLELHPILRNSIADLVVKQSRYNAPTGTFTIPPRDDRRVLGAVGRRFHVRCSNGRTTYHCWCEISRIHMQRNVIQSIDRKSFPLKNPKTRLQDFSGLLESDGAATHCAIHSVPSK
jgi:hypothetical protein